MAADDNIIIGIKIETAEAGKSLSELKKEFKEQQKELSNLTVNSKEYIAKLKELGGLKDEIGDLSARIKNFADDGGKAAAFGNVIGGLSSGFQAAQGAAALFGAEGKELQETLLKVQAASALAEGIRGVQGMKDQFKILGDTLKSNPILLIATIVIAIGTAMYALKDKIGFIGDAFKLVGKVIDIVIQTGKNFLDFIGVTTFALDKMQQSIIDNNLKIRDSNQKRYKDEIDLAKAAGKETIGLEILKLNAFTVSNNAIIKQLQDRKNAHGSLSEEDQKQLTELRESTSQAYKDIVILHEQKLKAQSDADIKESDKYSALQKKKSEDKIAADKAAFDAYSHLLEEQKKNDQLEADNTSNLIEEKNNIYKSDVDNKRSAELAKLESEYNATNQSTDAYDAYQQLLAQKQSEYAEQDYQINKELEDKKKQTSEKAAAEKQKLRADELAGVGQLVKSTQAVTDLAFAHQLRQANGNAAKEKEIRKKQFQVNKAFGIVNAVIDGVGAVQKALNNPYPLNIILAVASGVAAAANIAKIASSKFDGGGSGSGGGGGDAPSLGSLSSGSNGAPVNSPSSANTQLNADGTVKAALNQKQKVYVVESDITSKQNSVARIEQNAKI